MARSIATQDQCILELFGMVGSILELFGMV